jgi:hypothetical protein
MLAIFCISRVHKLLKNAQLLINWPLLRFRFLSSFLRLLSFLEEFFLNLRIFALIPQLIKGFRNFVEILWAELNVEIIKNVFLQVILSA